MTTYKLVGEEPTEEMIAAGANRMVELDYELAEMTRGSLLSIFSAMWKAAPEVKQEPVEIDWPDYHAEAMGCGLEDRCITDRYDAMHYGWDEAIERCAQCVPDALYALPPDAQAEISKRDAEIDRLKNVIEAWKEVAEDQYGKLRVALYGQEDYPVQGALDAYAAGRHPVLAALQEVK